MNVLPEEAYEVLDKQKHDPLIRDISAVATSAGIPRHMLWTSMVGQCSETEIEYFKKLRTMISDRGRYGIVYVGIPDGKATVPNRMMLFAAATIRNYINARVMTMRQITESIRDDSMPSPTVLCIPDFCMGTLEGGKVSKWVISNLLSLLYERQAAEQHTLLYIRNWQVLASEYGEAFASHLRNNFIILEF